MRMSFLVAFALAFAVLCSVSVVAGDAKDDAIAKDRNKIAGQWTIVKLVINGNAVEEENARRLTVKNQPDGTWSLFSEGKLVAKGTSTLDPTAKPKTIDFVTDEGDEPSQSFVGIYKLGKEKRRLCFADSKTSRPTAFASKPGSDHILVVFERIKRNE